MKEKQKGSSALILQSWYYSNIKKRLTAEGKIVTCNGEIWPRTKNSLRNVSITCNILKGRDNNPSNNNKRGSIIMRNRQQVWTTSSPEFKAMTFIDVPVKFLVSYCDHHSVPFIFHGGGCVLRPSVPRLLINFKLQSHDECLTWLISFTFSAFCLYITNLMWDACPYKDNSVLI